LNPGRGPTKLQPIEVDVECEACGHRFSFRHELIGSTRSVYGTRRDEAETRVAAHVERLRAGLYADLPARPCPHCGALQSWMVESARRGAGERAGCGVAFAGAGMGLAGLAIPGGPGLDLITVILVLIASLSVGALADRWIRRVWRPATVPVNAPRPPEIRYL
jgi:hypothetical protein